jgi:hypothetical protein
MALKIDATVIAYGPQPDTNLALIEVTVEFDRPDESMTGSHGQRRGQDNAHEARHREGTREAIC